MLEWMEFKYPTKVLHFFSLCPNHEDAVYESTPDEGLKEVLSIGCSDLPMNKFANEGAIHYPIAVC